MLKKMAEQNKNQPRQLPDKLEEIQGVTGVNIREYNMIDTVIESVTPVDYAQPGEEEQPSISIVTQNLDESGEREIRGRVNISLFRKDGILSYSQSANSNAQKILNFFKVNGFHELQGKPCKTIVRQNNDGNERLTIYFGQ
jgi:hypothetical protein